MFLVFRLHRFPACVLPLHWTAVAFSDGGEVDFGAGTALCGVVVAERPALVSGLQRRQAPRFSFRASSILLNDEKISTRNKIYVICVIDSKAKELNYEKDNEQTNQN